MSRHSDDSVGEEASALGQRVKGAVKEGAGAITGNESLRNEGESENAIGNARQESNNVFDETDGGRGATVGSTGAASTGAAAGAAPATGRGRMVTGLFRDRESAENAYQLIESRGYGKDDVNLVMSDEARTRHFAGDNAATELGDKALEGAGVGSAIGGTVGAVLAAIAAIGTSVVLPGLGLIVAGPVAAALAGAGAGGLTGGLIGALVGSGIPEERAQEYDRGIRAGGIMMGVNSRTDEDAAYIEDVWRRNRGESVHR